MGGCWLAHLLVHWGRRWQQLWMDVWHGDLLHLRCTMVAECMSRCVVERRMGLHGLLEHG